MKNEFNKIIIKKNGLFLKAVFLWVNLLNYNLFLVK